MKNLFVAITASALTTTAASCSDTSGGGGDSPGGGGSAATGGANSGGAQLAPSGGTAATTAGAGGAAAAGATRTGGAPSSSGGATGAAGGTAGAPSGAGGATSSGGASGTGGTAGAGMNGSGGSAGGAGGADSGGAAGAGGSTSTVTGPCDIYGSGNTPCVAAHSTIRALYGSYDGHLYQIRRASDKATKDITVLSPGGFADAAAQDSFCSGTTCTISIIYDQSPKGNHLTKAPAGGAKRTPDDEANATGLKLTVSGHTVYAVYINAGMGYRNNKTSSIATGDQPEGEYMVTSGKHYNGGCCFDYGNAETTNNDDGNGTMEAVYFGNNTVWGKGSGNGPWVMADLENGLFAGGTSGANNNNTPLSSDYVTAMVKGKAGGFAVKGGNAQSATLKTMYDGARPPNGYNPMKKQGAIILGIGGDNSNSAIGTFFEGCMTSGYPSDATDDAVQANVVAAGYGR